MGSENKEACALIWRHWQNGGVLDDFPGNLKPLTREAGYAIQAHFEACSASPRAGWKIAATSTAGQRHINVDGPLAGRLLAERLYTIGAGGDGVSVPIDTNRMRVCEPEFAFRFGEDIAPRSTPYSVAEVMAKVADLHLAIEIPDSRFSDFTRVGAAALIADNACARDLVVGGPVTAGWRDIDLATHTVTATVAGRYDREGTGANVLSDPRVALTWLVNEVSGLGITIRRGELVITGTCMTPLEIAPGDRVTVDYGKLGTIGVTLTGR